EWLERRPSLKKQRKRNSLCDTTTAASGVVVHVVSFESSNSAESASGSCRSREKSRVLSRVAGEPAETRLIANDRSDCRHVDPRPECRSGKAPEGGYAGFAPEGRNRPHSQGRGFHRSFQDQRGRGKELPHAVS